MPVHQVTAWIEQFGEYSMEAVSMLQIALGGLHYADSVHPDPFDRAMEKLVADIRKQTAMRFREFKTNHKRAVDRAKKLAEKNWEV